ncbi:MAG: N-acetylmuramoyl-L-alanine amidase [Cuspidothrix sp.]
MRFREWVTRIIMIFLVLSTLVVSLLIGNGKQTKNQDITALNSPYPPAQLKSPIRTQENKINPISNLYVTTTEFSEYRPKFAQAKVDPTNYGDRHLMDIHGIPFNHQPIIVIHETSNSTSSALNFFQTPHDDENVQASYHSIITLEGKVIYLVPPEKRAFGAGNSVFNGANGAETVQTNPNLPPSVNNFAYHVSLETPPDAWGKKNLSGHSGYTEKQYNSLAWLIAQSQIPDDRITTHKAVDVAGGKVDPLSFDFDNFLNKLHSFRQLVSYGQR